MKLNRIQLNEIELKRNQNRVEAKLKPKICQPESNEPIWNRSNWFGDWFNPIQTNSSPKRFEADAMLRRFQSRFDGESRLGSARLGSNSTSPIRNQSETTRNSHVTGDHQSSRHLQRLDLLSHLTCIRPRANWRTGLEQTNPTWTRTWLRLPGIQKTAAMKLQAENKRWQRQRQRKIRKRPTWLFRALRLLNPISLQFCRDSIPIFGWFNFQPIRSSAVCTIEKSWLKISHWLHRRNCSLTAPQTRCKLGANSVQTRFKLGLVSVQSTWLAWIRRFDLD